MDITRERQIMSRGCRPSRSPNADAAISYRAPRHANSMVRTDELPAEVLAAHERRILAEQRRVATEEPAAAQSHRAHYTVGGHLSRQIFGVLVMFHLRHGGWWWRVQVWRRNRRSVGVFRSREEAVKDAARMLAAQPELRGRR
jgi:hypothetical protein